MKKPLIFVTTGTQLPFDRLITQINNWASKDKQVNVIAQTANSNGDYHSIKTVDFLTPSEYDEYTSEATVIVGHAGMGTIITGFEKNKPLILMARKFQFGEHRNDHQQSTTSKFDGVKGVYIANDEQELQALLSRYDQLEPASDESSPNRNKLIDYLSTVIENC
ncbi:glycosyltransferase [Colwellia echini]|uniref:glycosyltransferase n=1 Tax=Colwellia echini TaxID=1982103 RepID=UPI00147809C7|nr:glycosyltransferase [Colwellia echini]